MNELGIAAIASNLGILRLDGIECYHQSSSLAGLESTSSLLCRVA